MCSDIYLDGQSRGIGGKVMYAGASRTYEMTGVSTSNVTEKPFMFSPLELTDDDEYLQQGTTAGLGDVKLAISYATLGLASVNSNVNYNPIGKIHERSKKAIGHKIGLGEEIRKISSCVSTIRHGPVVTFIFKYRPIDMLRANGIAPPAPEDRKRAASLTDGSHEVLDLTAESDSENDRRIKALRDELAGLERKRRKTTRIKQEPGSSSASRSGQTVSLEVVDLT